MEMEKNFAIAVLGFDYERKFTNLDTESMEMVAITESWVSPSESYLSILNTE